MGRFGTRLIGARTHWHPGTVASAILFAAIFGFGVGTAAASVNISHSSFNNDYHGHSITLGETHAWTAHDTNGYMHASADIKTTSSAQCSHTHDVNSHSAHAHCNISYEESLLNSHHIGFHQGSHDL